jgi:alkylated DNA repair dioxygenase AlkB
MSTLLTTPLQPTLLDGTEPPAFDRSFATLRRHELGDGAWVDVVPGWVSGADDLFGQVLDAADWGQHEMLMYDDVVVQPRLQVSWHVGGLPSSLDVLRAIGACLSARYRTALPRVSANLYRDGSDSVAWHGDRVARDLPDAIVACLSLGHRRPFRLRPRGGGPSLALHPGRGDLVVMGGTCQRTWQHAVPKVAHAGPRICVMFREAYTDADLRRAEAGRRARVQDARTA